MRYGNWDVLLFPHGSKTPLQEFRTQCFVTRDCNASLVQDPPLNGARHVSEGRPPAQLPVLTTFVGSLVHNAPFRVSIHSWDQPKASRVLERMARPGDALTFEARVCVDGVILASTFFNESSVWPHVIDACSQTDREGYQEPLRFPPFHQEILHASNWDAGQLLGRIRIVMAEGFVRGGLLSQDDATHAFTRVRDVIAFSFQHAPTHILEFSSIAWPNPAMWAQGQPRPAQGGTTDLSPAFRAPLNGEEDAHAHSPRPSRHTDVGTAEPLRAKGDLDEDEYWANQSMLRSRNSAWVQPRPEESRLGGQNDGLPDPFLDPVAARNMAGHRGAKKSSEDTLMPDVPASEPVRQSSSLANIQNAQNPLPVADMSVHEALLNRLLQAISPAKSDGGAPGNPANTPASSGSSSKHSTTTELQAVSHCLREAKGGSPSTSAHAKGPDRSGLYNNLISGAPCGPVHGKKKGEGIRESTPENRVAGADFTQQLSHENPGHVSKSSETSAESLESKRKRSLEAVCSSPSHCSCCRHSLPSSPSKKISRLASGEVGARGQSPRTPDNVRTISGGGPPSIPIQGQ